MCVAGERLAAAHGDPAPGRPGARPRARPGAAQPRPAQVQEQGLHPARHHQKLLQTRRQGNHRAAASRQGNGAASSRQGNGAASSRQGNGAASSRQGNGADASHQGRTR